MSKKFFLLILLFSSKGYAGFLDSTFVAKFEERIADIQSYLETFEMTRQFNQSTFLDELSDFYKQLLKNPSIDFIDLEIESARIESLKTFFQKNFNKLPEELKQLEDSHQILCALTMSFLEDYEKNIENCFLKASDSPLRDLKKEPVLKEIFLKEIEDEVTLQKDLVLTECFKIIKERGPKGDFKAFHRCLAAMMQQVQKKKFSCPKITDLFEVFGAENVLKEPKNIEKIKEFCKGQAPLNVEDTSTSHIIKKDSLDETDLQPYFEKKQFWQKRLEQIQLEIEEKKKSFPNKMQFLSEKMRDGNMEEKTFWGSFYALINGHLKNLLQDNGISLIRLSNLFNTSIKIDADEATKIDAAKAVNKALDNIRLNISSPLKIDKYNNLKKFFMHVGIEKSEVYDFVLASVLSNSHNVLMHDFESAIQSKNIAVDTSAAEYEDFLKDVSRMHDVKNRVKRDIEKIDCPIRQNYCFYIYHFMQKCRSYHQSKTFEDFIKNSRLKASFILDILNTFILQKVLRIITDEPQCIDGKLKTLRQAGGLFIDPGQKNPEHVFEKMAIEIDQHFESFLTTLLKARVERKNSIVLDSAALDQAFIEEKFYADTSTSFAIEYLLKPETISWHPVLYNSAEVEKFWNELSQNFEKHWRKNAKELLSLQIEETDSILDAFIKHLFQKKKIEDLFEKQAISTDDFLAYFKNPNLLLEYVSFDYLSEEFNENVQKAHYIDFNDHIQPQLTMQGIVEFLYSINFISEDGYQKSLKKYAKTNKDEESKKE